MFLGFVRSARDLETPHCAHLRPGSCASAKCAEITSRRSRAHCLAILLPPAESRSNNMTCRTQSKNPRMGEAEPGQGKTLGPGQLHQMKSSVGNAEHSRTHDPRNRATPRSPVHSEWRPWFIGFEPIRPVGLHASRRRVHCLQGRPERLPEALHFPATASPGVRAGPLRRLRGHVRSLRPEASRPRSRPGSGRRRHRAGFPPPRPRRRGRRRGAAIASGD